MTNKIGHEEKEHLTEEEHELLGKIIMGQMRVINKLQGHILVGEIGAKDSSYIDNCGRIGNLISGLGYLIAFRSGSNIDWVNNKNTDEETEGSCYPPTTF